MKFTEKEQAMMEVIEGNFTQCNFCINDIKLHHADGTVVVLANLAKKGILSKIGTNPATYKLIPENERVEITLPSLAAKIVELETGEIYNSVDEALTIKGSGYSKIRAAVNGSRRVAGSAHWCRLEDMPINFTKEDCLQKIEIIDASFGYYDGVKANRGKRVRCIETGQEFYSASDAAKFYSLSNDCVAAACRGERQTAGGYHWKYVEEDI